MGSGPESSRLKLAGAVAVALAGLALFLWWNDRGGNQRLTAAQPAPPSAMPRHVAPGEPPGLPAADDSAPHPDRGPTAVPVIPLGPDRPPEFPPGSQPLTEGTDPATSMEEDDPVDSNDPQGLHAVFRARRDVVHPPDPLVLDLKLVDAAGNRLTIDHPYARFRSERTTAKKGPWFRAEFTDDGSGADLVANDLNYTVTFRPTPAQRKQLIGFRLFIEVGFDAPGGLGPRVYGGSMMYTDRPHAVLNHEFTESVDNGSLIVGVGVTVKKAGRYKVIASLYGPDEQTAIAFAQQSMPLDTGEQSIPLTFFGKILHDRQIDGPYVLRYMMLFEEHPDIGTYAPGDTVDFAYTTHAYAAADFSPAVYQPPPSTEPQVTAQSPSQRDKPPPMYGDADRDSANLLGGGGGGEDTAQSSQPQQR